MATPIIDLAHAEKISRYIAAQSKLRYNLAERIYKDAMVTLLEWGQFQQQFQEGGDFEGLAEQFASDAEAGGMTLADIALLETSLAGIVAMMQDVERRSPGMFGISVPHLPEPEPEP